MGPVVVWGRCLCPGPDTGLCPCLGLAAAPHLRPTERPWPRSLNVRCAREAYHSPAPAQYHARHCRNPHRTPPDAPALSRDGQPRRSVRPAVSQRPLTALYRQNEPPTPHPPSSGGFPTAINRFVPARTNLPPPTPPHPAVSQRPLTALYRPERASHPPPPLVRRFPNGH